MLTETEIDTLRALQRCSTPERWVAFMALASYLAEHPELRLGQAVVNTLMPSPLPDTDFVIDNTYQNGHQVGILPAGRLAQPDLFYMTDAAAALAFTGRGPLW